MDTSNSELPEVVGTSSLDTSNGGPLPSDEVHANLVSSLFPVHELPPAPSSSHYHEEPFDAEKRLASFVEDKKVEMENMSRERLRQATRNQELPLARVKKIMKMDEALKDQMISAEVPIFLAKAAEIFVEELTLRAWRNTELGKRKTLQKTDISHGIENVDKMDFLVDFVPRPESRRDVPVQQPVLQGALPAEIIDGRVYVQHEPGVVQVLQGIQMPESDGGLPSGALLQATPIGQPIQLHGAENGDPSIITVNLPDGAVQHFQLQVPHHHQQ